MRLKRVVSKSRSQLVLLSCVGLLACAHTHPAPPTTPEPELQQAPRERAKPPRSAGVRAAETLLAKGDVVGARNEFEEVLAADPHDARAWLGLGLAHEAIGEPRQAEGAYTRAIEVEPTLAEAHNNLGLLLRDRGELDDAIAELGKALALDPKLASAQTNLALALEEAQRDDEALRAYGKATALSPKDAMLRANFGLFLLAHGDNEGALGQLRAGLRYAERDRAACVALGNGLRRAGKPDEAVRALRTAIAADDGEPTPALLSELALAQHAAGDTAGAKQSLDEAIALDADYATAYYLLGSIEAAAGDLKRAKQHYERCIQLEPAGPLASKAKQKLAVLKQKKTAN